MVRKQRRRRPVRNAPSIPPPEPSLEAVVRDLARNFANKVADAVRSGIEELSENFADEILASVRGARLSEIVDAEVKRDSPLRDHEDFGSNGASQGVPQLPSGRGRKRTRAEMAMFVDEIVALCKQHEDGIHAEEMRAILKVRSQDLARPIAIALENKKIKKTGQKRSTLYFAS
jgi:hypothetical protein